MEALRPFRARWYAATIGGCRMRGRTSQSCDRPMELLVSGLVAWLPGLHDGAHGVADRRGRGLETIRHKRELYQAGPILAAAAWNRSINRAPSAESHAIRSPTLAAAPLIQFPSVWAAKVVSTAPPIARKFGRQESRRS